MNLAILSLLFALNSLLFGCFNSDAELSDRRAGIPSNDQRTSNARNPQDEQELIENEKDQESTSKEEEVKQNTEEKRPEPPANLVRYMSGDVEDKKVAPKGLTLLLAGGGLDVDSANKTFLQNAAGGDVVVLRADDSDGYNSYYYNELGVAVDSVETLVIDQKEDAMDPYAAFVISHAEAIFIAGGDQFKYYNLWKDTPIIEALHKAAARGASIGGTSAGLAVLGEYVYTAANQGALSTDAQANPYNTDITLANQFLSLNPMKGIITDTHFANRDRMGRLVTFMARLLTDNVTARVVGLGVDEATAIVVGPDGQGVVHGTGNAYVAVGNTKPERCSAGQALEWTNVPYVKLQSNDIMSFPLNNAIVTEIMSSTNGSLNPSPY